MLFCALLLSSQCELMSIDCETQMFALNEKCPTLAIHESVVHESIESVMIKSCPLFSLIVTKLPCHWYDHDKIAREMKNRDDK